MDEDRDGPTQVQQRVQLDSRLGGAKRCPVEQRQAQIDGRGIQGVDGIIQIEVHTLVGVQPSGLRNHAHRQVVIDAPVAQVQCVRQRRARRYVAQSHMKQLGAIGRQADFDVAQGLAPRQLRKGHDPKQIGTTEGAHTRIAAVTLDHTPECLPWHEFHDLGKQRLANVHALLPSG